MSALIIYYSFGWPYILWEDISSGDTLCITYSYVFVYNYYKGMDQTRAHQSNGLFAIDLYRRETVWTVYVRAASCTWPDFCWYYAYVYTYTLVIIRLNTISVYM